MTVELGGGAHTQGHQEVRQGDAVLKCTRGRHASFLAYVGSAGGGKAERRIPILDSAENKDSSNARAGGATAIVTGSSLSQLC